MRILNQAIAHTMYSPCKTSSQLVDRYFVVSCNNRSMASHIGYRVVPRACSVLIVKRDERTGNVDSMVTGPHLKGMCVLMNPQEKWCIAELKPGACLTLFNLPGSSMKHTAFDLRLLNREMADRIAHAFSRTFSYEHLDAIISDYRPQLQVSGALTDAFDMLGAVMDPIKVSEVEKKAGISERRLQRDFEKLVGISPKQFQRIARLRTALDLAATNEYQNWTQIALKCGYFDQPHFTNELSRLLSLNPSQIKKLKLN